MSQSIALCYYEITIGGHGQRGGETHHRELSQEQAEKGIEALIKATYGAMFNHLVEKINKSVAVDVPHDAAARKEKRVKRRSKAMKAASIGILVSRNCNWFTLLELVAHKPHCVFGLYKGYFWL